MGVCEGEALGEGLDAVGGGGIGEALGGDADGVVEAIGEGPIFVDAVEVSGGESVSGTGGALDEIGGEVEGGLGGEVAVGIGGDGAFFEVDDDAGGDAEVEEGTGGGFCEIKVDGFVRAKVLFDDGAGLEFVDDEVIDVGEGGEGNRAEVGRFGGDDIAGGDEALFTGGGEDTGGGAGVFSVERVEGAQEHEVGEVEDAGV